MTDDTWRPLGVESEDAIAEYDALHDGVPAWMQAPLWAWVRASLTEIRRRPDGSWRVAHLREHETEQMAQRLRISLPNLRYAGTEYGAGQAQLDRAVEVLQSHGDDLQVVDYVLAHFQGADVDGLEGLLERSKSAWRVGTRSGRPGLLRRVPLGVQVGADATMARSGRAGIRLASAWEELYGPTPNPSEAYRLAILAVEDAAIPLVSPNNKAATLGTALKQVEDQGDWQLPMEREHERAPSGEVILGMMRLVWHGQHDRHGGQPSAPGKVSQEEATVAVGIATTLVQLFDAALVQRPA